MKKILIISKESGQTQKFIDELPDYLRKSQAKYDVVFAFYPHYETVVEQQVWTVIGLSPEVFIEEKDIRKRIAEIGIDTDIRSIRGVYFGLRRYDLIFPTLIVN